MIKPNPTTGMRHVALSVQNYAATEKFYVDLLGMKVEWRPDDHSVYLTSGNDNLALHHTKKEFGEGQHSGQHLDHIGFFLNALDDVDEWFDFLRGHDIKMKTEPKTHRDGARSFYCLDPDGNTVQMIFHPPQATE
jgi:catechol 2,3-dioxygenase-like lactoylglutathione lyase family enzyme